MLNKIKNRLALMQFWWAEKTIREGRDFEVVNDDLGAAITILKGNFSGVQFRFGPMRFVESRENLLEFNTVVVYNPLKADVLNPKFEKLTSNILRILLKEIVAEKQVIDENRNVDSGELAEERDFYEEVPPVLEERVSKRKSRKKNISADSGSHSEVQQSAKSKRTRNRTSGKKRPVRK